MSANALESARAPSIPSWRRNSLDELCRWRDVTSSVTGSPPNWTAATSVKFLGRILYHQDSSHLNVNKDFAECSGYIDNNQVQHALNRSDAKMLFMGIDRRA